MEPLTPQIIGLMMLCSPAVERVFDAVSDCCGEAPVGLGLVNGRQDTPTLVLTRDGDEGTSWSVVVISQDNACIAFTGGSWQDVQTQPGFE